jgi:signal peptidase I
MKTMLSKVRSFFVDLHEDETGPTTIEWILLIIVAIIVLIGIVFFARAMQTKAEGMEGEVTDTTDEAPAAP